MRRMIALLGRRDEPTDALREYCSGLAQVFGRLGVSLQLADVRWDEQGWLRALWSLWKQSRTWRGEWVLFQHTALMWSSRGFPAGVLAVLGLLRLQGHQIAVVFHDVSAPPDSAWIARLRLSFQYRIMRLAYRSANRSILTVPLSSAPWLPRDPAKAVFVPVGANLPPIAAEPSQARASGGVRTVAIFGVTGGAHIPQEVADIGFAVKWARPEIGPMRLVVLGRGSTEAESALRREFGGTDVPVSVLGLLPAEDVVRVLSSADVLLFVRGQISSRRSSAIAGIACGLPVVGYEGPETGPPVTEAGVQLVPLGDRQGLARALSHVLTSESLWQELHQRSLRAQAVHFSWDAIAARYLDALGGDRRYPARSAAHAQAEESGWVGWVNRK